MMMNTGGSAANTMVDNAAYGENESAATSAFASGLGTISGFRTSGYFDNKGLNSWLVNFVDSGASEVGSFVAKEAENRINEAIKKINDDNKIKDKSYDETKK